MDVVEVAPPYDNAEVTALAGATLAMEMICLYAARHKLGSGRRGSVEASSFPNEVKHEHRG